MWQQLFTTPKFWQRHRWYHPFLIPLSWLYYVGFGMNQCWQRWQQHRAPIPVIVIGNAITGGSGKTPTCLALAKAIKQQLGLNCHIITRGYGGNVTGPRLVTPSDTAAMVGDEALLLAKVAPTWVSRNRHQAAQLAAIEGADLVLLDDGLQHSRLAADLKILVHSEAVGIGNGCLLPAGPLREPLSSVINNIDYIINITHQSALELPISHLKPIINGQIKPVAIKNLKGKKLIAFCGLAYPQKFYDTITALGYDLVATHNFPDHHHYQPQELNQLQAQANKLNATLVTTAKDAVKIPNSQLSTIHVLNIELELESDDFKKLLDNINHLVYFNQSNQ